MPRDHVCALNSLGALYINNARPRDAEPVLAEALEFAEQQFGPNAAKLRVTALLLSISYEKQGKAKEAAILRERAERLPKIDRQSASRRC